VELGVMSSTERTQPTLPGVEEQATPTVGVVGDEPVAAPTAVAPSAKVDNTAKLFQRSEPRDAPYCYSCGNEMQRAGSCYVCSSCGATSGCS
jgi:ribonucleoside-diphosphate reductase alpha chain